MNWWWIEVIGMIGTLLFVAFAVAGLITLRLTALHAVPMWGKVFLAVGIVAAFLSPFLLRDSHVGNGTGYVVVTYTAYFLFVVVFLFFSFMLMRDVGWIGLKAIFRGMPSPFDAGAVLKANIGLGLIVLAIAAWSLYAGMRVPAVRRVVLESDKITAPVTVAVLPDIHVHRALSRDKVRGMVAAVNALKPDIIALPGDIWDDRADVIQDFVAILGQLQAPMGVYATDGNHEIYTGRGAVEKLFHAAGIVYLMNEGRRVADHIVVAGVPDVQGARIGRAPNPEKALALADPEDLTILLAHTPKTFDMVGNSADLQVSGHTHGGQIFPFHVLAKLGNTYLAGVYRHGKRVLYVSRGAGQWGPQMRFLSPSEITLITIRPKK